MIENLGDSIYAITSTAGQLPDKVGSLINDGLKPLTGIIESLDLDSIKELINDNSTFEKCDLPPCKILKAAGGILDCDYALCTPFKQVANFVVDGTVPEQCDDLLCTVFTELYTMLINPSKCTNFICTTIRNIFDFDLLVGYLSNLLNQAIAPIKGPLMTAMIVVASIVVSMLLMLVYIAVFK